LGFNRSVVKPGKNCGHFYEAYFAPEYLIGLNLCLPKNKPDPWSRQFSEASVFSTGQEIICHLKNPKAYYLIHNIFSGID